MKPEEDFSVIVMEERNIVVTDSLILAAAASTTTTAATTTTMTKRNFEMSSRPNVGVGVGVDSMADVSQSSIYNSEVFPGQSSSGKSSEAESPIPNHAAAAAAVTATPIHFSGLAFKQQNSIFHKVRFIIIIIIIIIIPQL